MSSTPVGYGVAGVELAFVLAALFRTVSLRAPWLNPPVVAGYPAASVSAYTSTLGRAAWSSLRQ